MALTISLPTDYDCTSYELFTFRSTAPDVSGASRLILRGVELIHDRPDTRVFHAQLKYPSAGQQRNVVCKLAYGAHSKASLATEARLYSGKLKHLQGVYVPQYYGHFIGQTDKGLTSCIILDYCGKRLDLLFLAQTIDFKRALVCAMVAIHNAGVRHFDIRNRNVLDNGGLPTVIDFGEAEDHECEREMDIIENIAAPMDSEFGCDELYQLCIDLRIWKPAMFKYIRSSRPASFLYRPYKLAETAPEGWSYEDAVEEAYRAIGSHIEECYPEDYHEWCQIAANRRRPARSRSRCSDES
ncbi:hypothetical protein DENSPDRAFT_266528 [Dentipellis sp. KUC8613]|nr:hypothetical protein DENSPDRAFT_266528 [Dentipellis sp. KUC8613]